MKSHFFTAWILASLTGLMSTVSLPAHATPTREQPITLTQVQNAAWDTPSNNVGRNNTTETSLEQVWDVVELMGRPVTFDGPRTPRMMFRAPNEVWVDGGCNRFSGRVERDGQGGFRISKYTGTHGACEAPSRAEAILNSALVMADNSRWDRGLVLRSGETELVRLLPSTSQDTQIFENWARRPAPPPTPVTTPALPMPAVAAPVVAAAAPKLVEPNCAPPEKNNKKANKRTTKKADTKGKNKAKPLPTCTPAQMKQLKKVTAAKAKLHNNKKAAKGKGNKASGSPKRAHHKKH